MRSYLKRIKSELIPWRGEGEVSPYKIGNEERLEFLSLTPRP